MGTDETQMTMELYEYAQRVNSKETFLEFLSALRSDWEAFRIEDQSKKKSHSELATRGWENPDLGSFLEAMSAWTVDMRERIPDRPSWRTFADMLMAAKIYE
jgi:hypothetical protein